MSTPQDGAGTKPAPEGDAVTAPRHPAFPWPSSEDPREWPDDDAPAVEWAVFYRDRLGREVWPTPSRFDVIALAGHLRDKAVDAYVEDHGALPDDETQATLYEFAVEQAEDSVRGPCGWALAKAKRIVVGDAEFRSWWTSSGRRGAQAHAHERGICVRLGTGVGLAVHDASVEVGSGGGAWAQVDVDVKHGADADGEWARLPGPADRSPSGGLHVYALDDRWPDAPVRASSGHLAPGVEVRTGGYAMLPAGAGGDPSRRWLRRDAPRSAPDALLERPRATRGGRDASGHQTGEPERQPWNGQAPRSGRVADVLADPVLEGERNTKVGAVVGMLARPGRLPADVVDAALAVCVEWCAGRDVARWRAALGGGVARDEDFAVEVVDAWLGARYQGGRPWGRGKVATVARSLWRTAERRYEAQDEVAGAADPASGDPVWREPAGAWGVQRAASGEAADPARTAAEVPPPPSVVPPLERSPPGEEIRQAATAPTTAPAIPDLVPPRPPAPRSAFKLGQLFRSLLDSYPEADQAADAARNPVPLDRGPPLMDFARGGVDANYPHGMSLGPWAARAMPGFIPGDMWALGAASAKGFKTFTAGWMLDGLALGTARRLLGEPGWANAPVVLVFWLTEMPRRGELPRRSQARHLGVPLAALVNGDHAASRVAAADPDAAREVVAHARMMVGLHHRPELDRARWDLHGDAPEWTNMSFHAAHRIMAGELVHEIKMGALPEPEGRGSARVVHDAGPQLVLHVREEMRHHRDAFCARHGFATDDVLVIVAWDPGQRYVDDAGPGKQALDALLNAMRKHLAAPETVGENGERRGGISACVVITSDTTKAAAKEVSLARFAHESPGVLAAEVYAGSQLIPHLCNTAVVYAEPSTDGGRTCLLRLRVLQCRDTAGDPTCYPFQVDLATGRLRAMDPATVPVPPKPLPRDEVREALAGTPYGKGGGGGGGGARDGGVWREQAGPRVVGNGGWSGAGYPTSGEVFVDLDRVGDEKARAEFLALHPRPSWDPHASRYRVDARSADRWVRFWRAPWSSVS